MTALVLVLNLFAGGCGENEFQPPPPPNVTVALPTQRDVVEYAEVTGTTEAFRVVEVRARVQGILQAVLYQEGMKVDKDTPLFQIEPAPFVTTRDAAQARVTSAQVQAKLADTTARRMERSAQDKAVSELQALEARAQADAAVAEVEVAKKELAIKQLDVDYTHVLAPISGRVARSNFKVGSLVGSMESTALTTIYDDSKIYTWFTMPDRIFLLAKQAGDVKDDQPFPEVELATEVDQGFPHRGQIDYADPAVDAETGTLRIRAVFDNENGALVGGLFVRCRISIQTIPNALLVPETAIGVDQVGRYVFVVDDQGTVERRKVELGPMDGDLRVINSGLKADDRVIVRGILRARPGGKVTAQTAGT